jgi:hypothetical protein
VLLKISVCKEKGLNLAVEILLSEDSGFPGVVDEVEP